MATVSFKRGDIRITLLMRQATPITLAKIFKLDPDSIFLTRNGLTYMQENNLFVDLVADETYEVNDCSQLELIQQRCSNLALTNISANALEALHGERGEVGQNVRGSEI